MACLQSLLCISVNSPQIICLSHLFLTIQSDFWWRYGAAAGQATDHAVNSAINVGITAFNVDNLGIKAVVKRTGKHTAQAILEDYNLQEKTTNEKQVEKSDK